MGSEMCIRDRFNALQIVRAIGARVIVSDLRQEKLDAALNLGVPAEDIVPVGKSVQEFVKENGLQGKIDTVLEFVGSNQTNQDAQQIGKYPRWVPLVFCSHHMLLE